METATIATIVTALAYAILEHWLGETNKIKANNSARAIGEITKLVIDKVKKPNSKKG